MESFVIFVQGLPQPEFSPAELQETINTYRSWAEELGNQHLHAERLRFEGVHLTNPDTLATDGPFLETKEIIGGIIYIRARNLDDAVNIARTCPLLDYHELTVRPVSGHE